MADEPTTETPTTETPTDAEETPTEESDAPAKPQRRSLMQTLFGWADGTEGATGGDDEGEAEDGGDGEIARPIELKLPPSPIPGQSKSPRSQPNYTPVKIVFLTGDYKGQQIDLGLGINELSGGQSANWEELAQSNIRQGLTFKNLTPRNISFDVTFWSWEHDVSHLVENLKHLQEITSVRSTAAGGLPYPPLLLLTIGSQRFSVVCTEISDKYEHPHPENKGFRFCTCSLTFKQISDKTTPDSLGRPSTGTPLLTWLGNTTDQERERQAQQSIVEESLFNGVTSEQSEQVRGIIKDNALNDKSRILELDPKSFVNLALAGGFSKELLADPEVQAKLKKDLATLFAENADGILSEDPRYFRLLTEALESGDPSNLPEVLREQFDDYKKDYNVIYQAIENQALDSTSHHGLFTKPEFLNARRRLFDFGGRGLELRQAQVFSGNIEDALTSKVVEDINEFLSKESGKSDDEIKEAFGLQTSQQIRILKNRQPYSSKQHFLNELRVFESDGLSGSGTWSKFVETQTPPPEEG